MMDFFGAGKALSEAGFATAANAVEAPEAALWAVLAVETSGAGFLKDRRPKILFERHVFSRLTGGRFDAEDPDVSAPAQGGYGASGSHQYDRLQAAIVLDRSAALQSASWGLGQIMGENFRSAGFSDVDTMVSQFVGSEDAQFLGMTRFVDALGLAAPLRAHDWQRFARAYNGPNYAAGNYDGLLAHFFQKYADGGAPDLRVRAAQLYLTYQGFSLVVDGVLGPATRDAVKSWRTAKKLPGGGDIDDALLNSLTPQV